MLLGYELRLILMDTDTVYLVGSRPSGEGGILGVCPPVTWPYVSLLNYLFYVLFLTCTFVITMRWTGEVVDNELFADPVTPVPAAAATAQQDGAGKCLL